MTSTLRDNDSSVQEVDPLWFESPAQRISTSGGTAPFYRLVLSEEGLHQLATASQGNNRTTPVDKNYWIGKDLSHAEDEKDFYLQILKIRKAAAEEETGRDFTEGIGLVEKFMLDYLGVLQTATVDNEDDTNESRSDLLVMRNMRNHYSSFRMIDLKIGEKTAQAGWKGKSRLRAMKHHVMDGLSNSAAEGYRLAGFNGCPEVFDSMDPLIDVLAEEHLSRSSTSTSVATMWGGELKESQVKMAKRIMLNSLDGTGVFRYFMDLHTEEVPCLDLDHSYFPVEVAEIVSHELMSQAVALARACHRVKIPQKWIGSSVAVVFDAGFFPSRSSDAEDNIRSKVLVRMFDWGRSELMTAQKYDNLRPEEAKDREYFWDLYKTGLDRLSYNATRFYYNQFTNSTKWKKLTIQVFDFDSMSADDYIGLVEIPLPDMNDNSEKNKEYIDALASNRRHKLKSIVASTFGSALYCSIKWMEFPSSSRLAGAWKVTINRATNLPPMDISGSSDPYCMVMADNGGRDGQHFCQRTCIRARSLNPTWDETIYVPVCKRENDSNLMSEFVANGMSTIIDEERISTLFEWDKSMFEWDNKKNTNMKCWSGALATSD